MSDTTNQTPLARTPLYDLHLSHGGRMVPFAGYEMPVQFAEGILTEHLHTRSMASLFDVSHMGQIILRPRSGNLVDAALALERLVPVDIAGIRQDRQRYAFFTNDAGGILDDLMVANRGDHLLLVVNAACKKADEAHLRAHLEDVCTIELQDDRALLALQGPAAGDVLARLAPETASMQFMDVAEVVLDGVGCIVSRSGYTGEDGFEIGLPAGDAVRLAERLLAEEDVRPAGLGARDSLRLEAGLCLYGSDIDTETTAVEAGLLWAVQKVRKAGGARAGGFPGADVIFAQMEDGPSRVRVGLQPEGRAPVRGGAALYATAESAEQTGIITSGAFGPSLGAPMAMGYVTADLVTPGTVIFAELRGKRVPMTVSTLPFVAHHYKR